MTDEKTLQVPLTAYEIETILDALEHAEEHDLFDRLNAAFSNWFNETDANGVYVNRRSSNG